MVDNLEIRLENKYIIDGFAKNSITTDGKCRYAPCHASIIT